MRSIVKYVSFRELRSPDLSVENISTGNFVESVSTDHFVENISIGTIVESAANARAGVAALSRAPAVAGCSRSGLRPHTRHLRDESLCSAPPT